MMTFTSTAPRVCEKEKKSFTITDTPSNYLLQVQVSKDLTLKGFFFLQKLDHFFIKDHFYKRNQYATFIGNILNSYMSENIMKALIVSFSIFREPVRNSPTSAAAKYTTSLAMYLSMSQDRLKKEAAVLIFQKSIQKLFRFIYLGYHNYRAQLCLLDSLIHAESWQFEYLFSPSEYLITNCPKDVQRDPQVFLMVYKPEKAHFLGFFSVPQDVYNRQALLGSGGIWGLLY